MDTKALRQKILDLAIRGKLVPQDPNDEPAFVLLERIRAQKQQMVKEGKLKAKDIKNDTVIFVGEDNLHYEKFQDGSVKCIEDEIPFEIPQGWEWCRFENIIQLISGQDLSTERYNDKGNGIPYITGASNLKNGKVIVNRWTTTPTSRSTAGDILLTVKGSGVGKMAFSDIVDAHIARQIMAMRSYEGVDNRYLGIVINAVVSNLIKQANGIIPGISRDVVLNILFPLPPISEQISIIQNVKHLLEAISDIENQEVDLQVLIKSTKSRILDLAIRGKLVPQDPNDEPASVLLERIRAEKEELIKQGKIKRDKKESVIFKGEDNSYYEKVGEEVTCIDDEIPFEIPENWCWCRMKQLMYLISGVTYNKRDIQKEGVRILRGGNLTNNNNIKLYDNDIFLPEFYIDRQNQIQDGDIIIVASTGSTTVIGKSAFVESYYPKTQIGGFLKIVRSINKQAQQILWLLFRSNYYHESILTQVGGVNINNIKSAYLEDMLISVPPRRELTLIVEKYLQFSLLLSNIEESLN